MLRPLLFHIYINNIPASVHSYTRLFADECILIRKITKLFDTCILQSDLNNIARWCDTWQMKLNTKKCKSMRITKSAINSNWQCYSIIGFLITSVTSYKYLGVHITNDLSLNLHVECIFNSANHMPGFLRHNFSQALVYLKLLLYKTLVQSKVEYASSIWDPRTKSIITSLKSFPKSFCMLRYYELLEPMKHFTNAILNVITNPLSQRLALTGITCLPTSSPLQHLHPSSLQLKNFFQ